MFLPLKVLILSLPKKWAFPACNAASGRCILPPCTYRYFFMKMTLEQMETGPKISLQRFLILYFLLFNELLEALKQCPVLYLEYIHTCMTYIFMGLVKKKYHSKER